MADDRMTTKEYLARRWKAHREAFRVGGMEIDGGGHAFAIVDRAEAPPLLTVVTAAAGGTGIKAFRASLRDDTEARGDIGSLAAAALSGALPTRELPMREALAAVGLVGDRTVLADASVARFAEGLGDARIVARLPREDLVRAETKRFEEAGLALVRDAFEPEALRVLSSAPSLMWRDYQFYAAPGEKGLFRRQAAEQYPVLATVLAGSFSLRAAIDGQKPLAQAVVDAFTPSAGRGGEASKPLITKAALNRLRGVAWPCNGITPDRLAFALSEIPADWFPKDRENWDAFCDIHATVGTIIRQATGQTPEVLYEGAKGDWVGLRERLARVYNDTRPPEGTSEQDEAYLKEAIPWKEMEKMPREKVHAAAIEAVSRLDRARLSENLTDQMLVSWLTRFYAPDVGRNPLEAACRNVEAMLDAFTAKVVLPIAANATGAAEIFLGQSQRAAAQRAAATILCAGKSAVAMLESTRVFLNRSVEILGGGIDQEDNETARKKAEARNQRGVLNAIGIYDTEVAEDGWAPLTPAFQASNGVWCVFLTDPRLCEDEGRGFDSRNLGYDAFPRRCADGTDGLNLCVGGDYHVHMAQKGQKHIMSFRELTGDPEAPYKRLSVAAIVDVDFGARTWKLSETIKSQSNGAVHPKAEQAWDEWQKAVKEGRVEFNEQGIRKHAGAARAKSDDVAQGCGFDWREMPRLEAAMAPWGRLVGKRYRKMRLADFSTCPEMAAVSEEIEPGFAKRRAIAAEDAAMLPAPR